MYKNIIFLVFILLLFIDDLYLFLSNITLILLVILLIFICINLYNSTNINSYNITTTQLEKPSIVNIVNINKNILNRNKIGNKNLYN